MANVRSHCCLNPTDTHVAFIGSLKSALNNDIITPSRPRDDNLTYLTCTMEKKTYRDDENDETIGLHQGLCYQ